MPSRPVSGHCGPLARRKGCRPCFMKLHWQPNRNNSGRGVIFPFKQVVICGDNAVVSMLFFRRRVPLEPVTLYQFRDSTIDALVNVIRMTRSPKQGGDNRRTCSIDARTVPILELHRGKAHIYVNRSVVFGGGGTISVCLG